MACSPSLPASAGDPSAVVLVHGWGFGAWCFADWRAWRSFGAPALYDRGYYGSPLAVTRPAAGALLWVTHSLGLHFLEHCPVRPGDFVVVLAGFVSFHGETPAAGRFSRRHLERLRRRIDVDPAALVADFHRDCGWQGPVPDAALDTDRLGADLALLDEHVLDPEFLAGCRVLVLHGQQDRIVPQDRAQHLTARLPGSRLEMVADAGHGLPFTHGDWCRRRIEDWIEYRGDACVAPNRGRVHGAVGGLKSG